MFVIGNGRVGGALVARANAAGVACTLVDRLRGWDAMMRADAPILVVVRNDDLDTVLQRLERPNVRKRLVFMQNGMLRSWLSERGLCDPSRGLLFFAVPSRGAPLQPGGDSLFTGPLAEQTTAWFGQIDVPARTVTPQAFARAELEKLLWNCAFGLLCQRYQQTVGEIVRDHYAVLQELVYELIDVGQSAFGLSLDSGERVRVLNALCAYSNSIPDYRGAVKEWRWRNGWFVQQATAKGLHGELLDACGLSPNDRE